MPLGQSQDIPQADPKGMATPRFWHRLIRFRHVISGSLALASLNHTCRNLVPTFPQCSPPSLLTTAAFCGLRSTPVGQGRTWSIPACTLPASSNPTPAISCNCFDMVPKPFAVAPFLGRTLRQHDLGMDDAALVGEVVAALKSVVAQPRGRAVGGGRHRAAAGFAADDLDVKMI